MMIIVFSTAAFQQEYFEAVKSSGTFQRERSNASNLESQRDKLSPLRCEFAPGLIVGNRIRELQCCNKIVREHNYLWLQRSLTFFLETLKQWNCPQLKEQCHKPKFAFTPFSKLIYDYFCNYTNVVESCFSEVLSTVHLVQKRSGNIQSRNYSVFNLGNISKWEKSLETTSKIKRWKGLISLIKPSLLTLEKLKEPCIGIAQYDTEEIHNQGYQELNVIHELTSWCGFSAEAFWDHEISFSTCLSSRSVIMRFCISQ